MRLPLPYARTGLGLPGVCLTPAPAMAARCGIVPVLLRRAPAQEEADASLARAA